MFSAAPKAKDSDEEDDGEKKEKKGGKEKNVDSDKKPAKKTVETSSGTKTQVQKLQCLSCCVAVCQCCCLTDRITLCLQILKCRVT